MAGSAILFGTLPVGFSSTPYGGSVLARSLF
jgi:hypothetical protein